MSWLPPDPLSLWWVRMNPWIQWLRPLMMPSWGLMFPLASTIMQHAEGVDGFDGGDEHTEQEVGASPIRIGRPHQVYNRDIDAHDHNDNEQWPEKIVRPGVTPDLDNFFFLYDSEGNHASISFSRLIRNVGMAGRLLTALLS